MSRPATPRLLRRINAQLVLDAVRDHGPSRVAEIVSRTGMSRPTVDAVAADLVRLGWLEEVAAPASPRRGRPARSLAFRANAGYVAGLDIGEITVRAAIADLRGDIVAERHHVFDGDDRLEQVRATATATLEEAGLERSDLLAACVGCTGAMDTKRGRVLFSSVFPSGFDLSDAMRGTLGRCVVENDCNLAVMAERWCGAAQGVDDVVCVLAGERIGAGIVIGGQLMRGHVGAAGELSFVSALNLEPGAAGVAQLIRHLSGDDAPAVVAAAEAGDERAAAIVERASRWAGHGVVTTAQIVNPEIVVIGGGVARAGEVLLAPMRRLVEESAPVPPVLVASPLAERGPLLGAVRVALDDLELRLLDGLDAAAA